MVCTISVQNEDSFRSLAEAEKNELVLKTNKRLCGMYMWEVHVEETF